ncbi:hypothetical protein [Rossellomorea sp. y25]|uniref:hypothetical protein n=1 Tax=Rossellomorea sp. y25 TaxID=3118174 RepID=UPI0030DF680D
MSLFQELQASTKNFMEPAALKNQLDITNVYEAPFHTLLSMAKSAGTDDSYRNNLRIYVNGESREDLEEYILLNPPHSFGEIEEWGRRTFKGQDFLVVINRVEKWYNPIVNWCGSLFEAAKGQLNEELLHLEVTYFIGNTTYTPFGVHIDEISEALHLNLGPNERYMYLWEPETYKKVRGSYEPLINPSSQLFSHSQKNTIAENDWFFLPASKYFHVGENTDFSVSLAVAMIRFDENDLFKRAMELARHELGDPGSIDIKSIIKQTLHVENNQKNGIIPLKEIIKSSDPAEEAIIQYVLRIRSNLGFRVPTKTTEKEFPALAAWKDSSISLTTPFKLLVLEKEDGLDVFARANMISLVKHDVILEIMKKLNMECSLNVKELVKTFHDQVNEDSIYLLCKTLYKCGVLEVGIHEYA